MGICNHIKGRSYKYYTLVINDDNKGITAKHN